MIRGEYYLVICTDSLRDLVVKVDEHIRHGWKPCGGVGTHQEDDEYVRFYQAMSRELVYGPQA